MSVTRHTSPDRILAEIGQQLFGKAVEFGLPEDDPNRRLAVEIRRADVEWQERFRMLSSRFFQAMPLVFLLDDFDENLAPSDDGGAGIAESDLAELLSAWVESPGSTRLLVTSRQSFLLPNGSHRRLTDVELTPMAREEAEALMARLPALAKLDAEERGRIVEAVGGHPLALEMVAAWKQEDASATIEFAVKISVRDLLAELLTRLGSLSRQMLVGASIFRVPVDDLAFLWQVGEEQEEDPELATRVQEFNEAIEAAQQAGKNPTPSELGMTDQEFVAALSDMEAWMQPPLIVPDGFHDARDALVRLGLLQPAELDGETKLWTVQRWMASLLAELVSEGEIRRGHRRAAGFWRFRVQRKTEGQTEALEQLVEARFHFAEAGAFDEALGITEKVCDQLEAWGSHRRIEQLCREALAWIPQPSRRRAAFLLQLGLAQERRGLLDEARTSYQGALEISEELEHMAAVSGACHQLGRVAQTLGSHQEALDWYQRSLALSEELGLPSGTASTISQLGVLETERGSPETGLALNLQSLAIRLEIGSEEAGTDLYWLRRQREDLGSDRFEAVLQERLGDEGTAGVLTMLERFESTLAAGESASHV